MREEIVDLGEYKIIINHGDNGYLHILVLDELGGDVEAMEIEDEEDKPEDTPEVSE